MSGSPGPDTRRRIVAVIEDVLDARVGEFQGGIALRDFPDWDSIAHLRLVLELEQRFGIAIPDEEAAGLATLDDIAALVGARATDGTTPEPPWTGD